LAQLDGNLPENRWGSHLARRGCRDRAQVQANLELASLSDSANIRISLWGSSGVVACVLFPCC